MDRIEFLPKLQDIESEVYLAVRKDINKRLKDLPNYAIDNFKNSFMNEDGLPRDWIKIEESQISKLFTQEKKQNAKVFELFKQFKLIKNPLKCKYFNNFRL